MPLQVQRAIEKRVGPAYRYVPMQLPAGWRYFSWAPSRGGLDIRFTTPDSYRPCGSLGCTPQPTAGPGFDVVDDPGCSLKGAMETFRIGGVSVAWSATFEDARAWRCLAQPGRASVIVSVNSVGTGNDPKRLWKARARALAETVASARLVAR